MIKSARTVADLPRRAKRNFTRVKKCSRPKPKSLPRIFLRIHKRLFKWWQDPELNRGHKDFQSSALPTELSCRRRTDIKSKFLIDDKSQFASIGLVETFTRS
jgi:hypothetical protein